MRSLLITLFLALISLSGVSQCIGDITYNLSVPPSANNTYPPGTVVELCITMDGWDGNSQGSNWFEGFYIALGGGWQTVTPTLYPQDAEDASGTWIWATSTTSTNGATAGNGFYFEGPTGPLDGNAGNDWGDSCPSGTCIWSCCVELVAANGPPGLDLHIGVIPYSDGTMGSWGTQMCNEVQTPLFEGSIGCFIPGCTNIDACNYDINSDCDDGSCILPGCTDPLACNYDQNAPCDNGSCVYGGCTDPGACNFDPAAGCDDGSCGYFSMSEITHNFIECPDTTCVGSIVWYSVNGSQSSSYSWDLNGGGSIEANGSSDCQIEWGNIPGTYTVSAQEVTAQGCLGQIETCQVEVIVPDITFDSSYNVCYNQSVQLSASPPDGIWLSPYVNGDVFIGYSPGVNWPVYSVDIHGCNVQESIDVTVYPLYQAPTIIYDELKVDLCLSDGQKVYYSSDDRSSSYYWSLNGSSVLNDGDVLSISWPDTSEIYLLSVYGIDDRGCLSESGGINVEVESCHRIYVPNSFTPNGDGINDVFRLSGAGIYDPRLVIYNRWGYPVFETTDLRKVWNGDDGTGHYSETDAYNWKVYYRDNEGFKRERTGTVILIR